MYQELAAATPNRYRPHLAASLDNLGNRLADLGRPAEAAAAHHKALRARAQPD